MTKDALDDAEQDAVNEMVWSGWNRKAAEREVRANRDPAEAKKPASKKAKAK